MPGLADRLLQLARDASLRARMGSAGRRIVVEDFDVHTLTDRLIASYERLLHEPTVAQTRGADR